MTAKNRSGRGTVYLLVLMSSVIVTLIGLMGFRMLRAQAAIAQSDTEREEALVIAESAVQWGVHIVTLKGDWRDDVSSGVPIRTGAFGQGSMTVTITDKDDGDLADDITDEFVIAGTGVVGDAQQTLEVTMRRSDGAHPALEKSITLGGTLEVDAHVLTLQSGGTASNQTTTKGGLLIPSVVDIEDPVDLPDASLIDTWAAMGTVIDKDSHTGSFSGETFSKTTAPAGIPVDPNGIYVIDANNSDLTFTNCTIQGTLIVCKVGVNTFRLDGSKLSFGDHGGPTLIVDGNVDLATGWGVGVHQGLIYVDGDISITDDFMLVGSMFATGDIGITASFMTINDHPSATSGPPVGYTENTGYEVVTGSWDRVVN